MEVPLFMPGPSEMALEEDISHNRSFRKPSWQGMVDDSRLSCAKDLNLPVELCGLKNKMQPANPNAVT
jgi:hypothetical protein